MKAFVSPTGSLIAIHNDSQEVEALYPGATVLPLPNDTPIDYANFDVAALVSNLDGVKAAARRYLDILAEQTRTKFITPGSGQAMVYQQKEEEAAVLSQMLQHDPEALIELGDYPHLHAEIGITVPDTGDAEADIKAMAQTVLASATGWRVASAAIEAARLSGKKAVTAATDWTALSAAIATAQGTLTAVGSQAPA